MWLSHIHIPQYLVILPQNLLEHLPNFEALQCALAGVEFCPPSSWHSAVFWVQCQDYSDNTWTFSWC